MSLDDPYDVKYLNALLVLDQKAMTELFQQRVQCNEDLSNHSTIQVLNKEGKNYIGLMGIINGIFGVIEEGQFIVMCFDSETNLIKQFDIMNLNVKG